MTWVHIPEGSDFPLSNLPYGIANGAPAAAIGEHYLDLRGLARAGLLLHAEVFEASVLNPFMALGPIAWASVRERLQDLVSADSHRAQVEPHLHPLAGAQLSLPFAVGDYVDFYSSRHHAENLGRLFRPDGDALTPNWLHLPIGYHGRSGTVVVSGTEIARPHGQRKPPNDPLPSFGPSVRLDIEAEVGFVIGVPSALGEPVHAAALEQHVFGVVLVNDWSARDLQSWEYVPLGPFLGKSFATSISPWVVPLAALEAARVPRSTQPDDPEILDYLRPAADWGLDIELEVEWNETIVSRPPFRTMQWTMDQQLAHATVNGASVRTGDLFASGTVSGPGDGERGSFIELSWNGRDVVQLDDGSTRTFLEDGDTVVIRASAPAVGGGRLGFGEVRGTVT